MYIYKKYETLDFTNDFMFCKILENNEDLCKELVEVILGRKVSKITYKHPQKAIEITADGKGIRLDVYFEGDDNTAFDLEMQTTPNRNIPKRSRYYQGMIDLDLIGRGKDYIELDESFIIFICMKNPFETKSRHKYSFENICAEYRYYGRSVRPVCVSIE